MKMLTNMKETTTWVLISLILIIPFINASGTVKNDLISFKKQSEMIDF